MPKRKAAEAADVKKKAADIWQCRLLCLKDLDHSGDTEASSRLWEVVYDADDETLKLFDELKLSEISLPRPWLWQDEDSGDPQHLETALGRWSQQQRKLYRQLASKAQGLLDGKGVTLARLAGQGPLEVAPGKVTVRSSFLLKFCTHAAKTCPRGFFEGEESERPTCRCDIFCLVDTAGDDELRRIQKRLRR
ncbi:unnamed protein product [Effrenium voratum]|nr:unnamed protein product [Effrenium voratum]